MSLCGLKLSLLPPFSAISASLSLLLDVNLARNELFNGAQVFGVSARESEWVSVLMRWSDSLVLCQVLSQLKRLRRLNLNNNCLNGSLHDSLCDLTELEGSCAPLHLTVPSL